MKSLSIILLFIIPVSFSNCLENDELPPITKEGKYTFGCFVNGRLWLPEGGFNSPGIDAQIQMSGDTIAFNLYASAHETGFTFSIYDSPDLQINKTYDLASVKYYTCYSDWSSDSLCEYDSIIGGSITLLRFDRKNNIESGIFEFKAYSTECKETVTVTEGRFDL